MKALIPLIYILTANGRACIATADSASTATRSASNGATAARRVLVDPSINLKALWDGRAHVDFHAANYPKMLAAADAKFLNDDEYVLGITANGESKAYPTRLMAWHHVVNDSVGKPEFGGKAFVTVTYCIVCNTGIRFDPVVDGKPLKFDFFGLYNGVMTMFDTQTKTVWLQVGGKAIKGAYTGTQLKTGPVLDTTWRRWKQLHPDTLVMAPQASAKDDYDPQGMIVDRGFDEFPTKYFRKSLTRVDTRLPLHDLVLAVCIPASSGSKTISDGSAEASPATTCYRAYPLKDFGGASHAVNESVEGSPIAVFYEAGTNSCTAVSAMLGGRMLTFECRRLGPRIAGFFDIETGTRWSIEGTGIAGPLVGKQLNRLDGTLSEWYGWAAYYPQTSIYHAPARSVAVPK